MAKLLERFKATFDGAITQLLGMAIERPTSTSYLIHQAVAIADLAREQGLAHAAPVYLPYDPAIPIDKISTADSPSADSTVVRSILGSVNYFVTMTRPDVAFALNRLQRHAHNPKIQHLQQARHLVRYLNSTPRRGLRYTRHRDA